MNKSFPQLKKGEFHGVWETVHFFFSTTHRAYTGHLFISQRPHRKHSTSYSFGVSKSDAPRWSLRTPAHMWNGLPQHKHT